ncbi:MAG: FtsW/RodA/SpoVE family cell cycle protein [Candidatus Blackburnbacteria bacterium]|nr:FtsW/RodA/SpoVE family cell cycle protein [Candidatus Blackburnbacteria bacterium]
MRVDPWIFLPAVFLSVIGILILSSVSQDSFPNHFFYLGAAFIVFVLFANTDIKILRQFSPVFYFVSILFLLLTLIFAGNVRGSSRWLALGGFMFQPSELVKPFLVLFFAHIVARGRKLKFLWVSLLFLPPWLLVFLQPDFGSSMVLLSGFLGVVFLGGIPLRLAGCAFGVLVVGAPIFWKFLEEYQKHRIFSFLSPGSDPLGTGYNSIQSVIAVGSGGLLGRGLGQGTQSQLAFLPERHTDFIFAAMSEDLGFIASVAVIFGFGVILFRIVSLMKNDTEIFSQALLAGIFSVLFVHVVINIGMNVGVLPITGIPLPFISSGGSSLISMSAMLGMVSQIAGDLNKRGSLGIMGGK